MPVYVLDEQRFSIEFSPQRHSYQPEPEWVPYDPQLELDRFPATGTAVVLKVGVLTIPPEATLVYEHKYPRGATYRGKAEQCTAKVTILLPEQLFPDVWMAERIAGTFDDEAKNQGGEMLALKILMDATPLLTTDYYIVATVTAPPAALIASPFPWSPFLAVVIPLVLIAAILGLFIISIMQIKSLDWPAKLAVAGIGLAVVAALGAAALAMVAAKKKK